MIADLLYFSMKSAIAAMMFNSLSLELADYLHLACDLLTLESSQLILVTLLMLLRCDNGKKPN